MKRLFYILLFFHLALLLFLCPACRKNDPRPLPDPPLPIDCRVTIHTDRGSFKARLLLEKQGSSLTLADDEQTSGITFALSEEGVATLSAKDLTLQIPKERLPEKGLLFEAMRLPSDTPFLKSSVKEQGQRLHLYTFVRGEGNFLFYLTEQGRLHKIVFDGADRMTVVFEE